ncbi:hypothetical protein ARMA_2671 [Ardenticatena maritima]|uniref:Uncharacterized protein n=1 Tax=Ardenticatena maritima TaxID=872965 RepID=A0A0M9UDP4_9CHLR|nr:hypothetical protein ARMA_2671 [Ardenticatena maritima]
MHCSLLFAPLLSEMTAEVYREATACKITILHPSATLTFQHSVVK